MMLSLNAGTSLRTEGDINRFIDAEKPNPEAIAALRAKAPQQPPPGMSSATLASFLFGRAVSKRQAGMLAEALADAELAIRTGVGTSFVSLPAKIFMGNGSGRGNLSCTSIIVYRKARELSANLQLAELNQH